MVRLHIRGADANYRRLRHLRAAAAALCVVIVFFLHHKANFHPRDKKRGAGLCNDDVDDDGDGGGDGGEGMCWDSG